MRSIYVASAREQAGKSVAIISLALKAKEMGKRVGYFKPVGRGSFLSEEGKLADEDVEIVREVLELKEESDLLCPLVLKGREFLEDFFEAVAQEYLRKILAAYERVSADKDLLFTEGPDTLSTGAFLNLSVPELAREFSSEVLLVSQAADDSVVDELIRRGTTASDGAWCRPEFC